MPDVFRPYPGGVTERSVARNFEPGNRMLISIEGDRMDDFPFQLSRMVQRRGRDERWHTTQRLLKELIVPILDAKGYFGEQEAKNHYPHNEAGGLRPPKPKECVKGSGRRTRAYRCSIMDKRLFRRLMGSYIPRVYEENHHNRRYN